MSRNQNGGGKGGPWGKGPASGSPPPFLEKSFRRVQARLRQVVPGGIGFIGISLILLAVALAIGYFAFTVRINPDERAVVRRFGKYNRELSNGLHFRWPYPIEEITVIPYTRQNRVEVDFNIGTPSPYGFICS